MDPGIAEKNHLKGPPAVHSHSLAEHVQVTETMTRHVLGLPCNKRSGEKVNQ